MHCEAIWPLHVLSVNPRKMTPTLKCPVHPRAVTTTPVATHPLYSSESYQAFSPYPKSDS